MKKYYRTIISTTIVVAILVVGYFTLLYSMIYLKSSKIENSGNLTIKYLNKEFDLDVNAEFWQEIEPEIIHLYPQSARSPYGTSEKDLLVRAVYNDDEVAFLLEFNDDTRDLGAPVNPDACAILFAPSDAPSTAQMMGYGSKANVWQWLADRNVERFYKGNESIKAVRELIASGPGTQTPLEKQNVDGKGEYENDKWSVAFKRKLKSNQDGELEFQPDTKMKIAFAIWNGAKMESFSRKSIAILRTLAWEKK